MTDHSTHLSHDAVAELVARIDKAELAKRFEYALKGLQFIYQNALNFDNPKDALKLQSLSRAAIEDAIGPPALPPRAEERCEPKGAKCVK